MRSGGGETIDGRLRPCDFCKAAASALFCLYDSSFLCLGCDHRIHCATTANLRHGRVWVCDVCKHAPAAVTCDADAASLCISCDCDVHSANPISGRHVRRPVEPFLETVTAVLSSSSDDLDKFLCENDGGASWMDIVKFADSANATSFGNSARSIGAPSVPSPSQDFGVVLDVTMAPPLAPQSAEDDRKARVLRYKEKKKNRKFDKTVRYTSRKAYADARPRTKGRFVKKTV